MLKKIIILKNPIHIFLLALCGVLCFASLESIGQSRKPHSHIEDPEHTAPRETPPDTTFKADTKGMDSLVVKNEKGDIETIIYYHAEDSIRMDVVKKTAYLFGKAQIKYKDMQLDANHIEINWAKNEVFAKGSIDSTGKYRGKPVWKQGSETYGTDSMRYNMNSKKAMVYAIETQQGEGYLQGDTSKRTEDAIYLKNGIYTTCNRKHPHFYINARKLKVIPEDKAITGPFNLVIEDIQTPIGFWMGFFPITDKKKSGIIFPTFGENQSRGMFLSQGGYYWAINDYVGLSVVGDIYANGSWLLNANAPYIKRYKYQGSADLRLSNIRPGFDETDKGTSAFLIAWNHSTIARRNSRLTASVNLSSSKFAKQNFNTVSRTQNTSTSSVTFSKTFGKSPFSASVSLRANQNNYQTTATNKTSAIYDVTLPSATLTMNRINPLKRKVGDGNLWYEKVYVNYQGNFGYNLSNKQLLYDTLTRKLKDSTLQINETNLNKYILPNSNWSSQHSASISSTTKLFKFLNINPSVNFYENLHGKKLVYQRKNDSTTVKDTLKGIYQSFYFNTKVEVNTRIYGTKYFGGNHLIKGIRHTFNPSATFTYAPDFSSLAVGGYVSVEGDVDSRGQNKKYFQYMDNATPLFKTLKLDVSLKNMLDLKIKNRKDTTGANPYKNIPLLENLQIDGGYNFGADSLRLSNILVFTKTRLFNKIDVNLTSTYDPYRYVADSIVIINGKKEFYNHHVTNTYLYKSDNRLAQLARMNLTLSTRFAPKKKSAKKDPKFTNPKTQAELDFIRNNPNLYLDFNIPWSLGLSYTYNYTNIGLLDPTFNQSITANGDLSLTPKWKLTFNTGYNIDEKTVTYSTFGFSRDLHCWQMNMNLSPFGSLRTFTFTIMAKSSLLQTLKLNKRSPSFIQ